MRVMTYNIHGWRTIDGIPNLDAVARVIAEIDPDIVGLNEVFYPRVVDGAQRPALEALADRLRMEFVFGPCLRWPAQDDLPADAYGNALLSRWPIVASAAHHLTAIDGTEQRGLLEARILLPNGSAFTAYVLHLDYTAEAARLTQLRAVRTWTARDRNRPHLVMGDFNAVSMWDFAGREEALRDLSHHPKGSNLCGGDRGPCAIEYMEKHGYSDLYRLFGEPAMTTFVPATVPIRIDYLFASQSLAPCVTACRIWRASGGVEASDHRPVVAEIDLPTVATSQGASWP